MSDSLMGHAVIEGKRRAGELFCTSVMAVFLEMSSASFMPTMTKKERIRKAWSKVLSQLKLDLVGVGSGSLDILLLAHKRTSVGACETE